MGLLMVAAVSVADDKGAAERSIGTPLLSDSSNVPATRPPIRPKRFSEPTRTISSTDSAVPTVRSLPVVSDSTPELIGFRIHLLTSNMIGDARAASQIAEELFDQPVQIDYEVPYYKLRVGEFANRRMAEEYLIGVKRAGYPKAWVVPFTRFRSRSTENLADSTAALQGHDSLTKESPQ